MKQTSLRCMRFHDAELLRSQCAGFVQDLLGDILFPNVVQRGQGRIPLDFQPGQRGDHADGGKNKEHLLRQMLKLGAVGGMLDQERRPVQHSRHGFGMSLQNSHLLFWYSLGRPLFRSRPGVLNSLFWAAWV